MAFSIVKSVAQQLGNLSAEEAKSWYKVRDKIESLKKKLEWMEYFLRDADSQPHQGEVICKWVFEVQDLACDAEDIIERYLHDVSHHRRDGVRNTLKWVFHILRTGDAYTLHNLGSDIDCLNNKISELTSMRDMCDITRIMPTSSTMEYNRKIMEDRRTYSHTEEDVVGLDTDIEQVVDRLVKTAVKVVGIRGIGGLGKTTLARKVFKHKDIKDYFNDNCAWVYVSKEFEKGNISQQILLELEKGEEAKKRIKEQLHVEQFPGELHKLLQEKRCLVVVDDIWTEKDWESLKPGLESACSTTSASKILFTTRNQGLLQHVNPRGYLHPLNHLSNEESWELLKRKAFIGHWRTGGESSTHGHNKTDEIEPQDDDQVKHEGEMEKLGREMLKHCDGLPIAIVTLGGILSSKNTVPEWKKVRDNISSYLISDINQGGNLALRVLELSYHDLPFYLKPCFLYLGSFPEDYTISTQRLYHLWEAEGFLVIEGFGIKYGGTSYDVGERFLNELIQRSVVQVGECWPSGRIKTCRVHDVMRDMCHKKCGEVGFLSYIERGESDKSSTVPAFPIEMKKLRRCALNDEKGDFVDKHFEHGAVAIGLRSLLVFQDQMRLEKVWICCPLLRVLDLQGILGVGSIEDVGDLSHLRYLSLRKSGVDVLPSCLYDLKHVETLDLRLGLRYRRLQNKFDKMKKLRHLYLPYSFEVEGGEKLKFPNDGLHMETLKNFDPERCEATMLIQMTNLRVFSIRRGYIFKKKEEVKRVLEAPVMKNEEQLINSFRLKIRGVVIQEEPRILSSAARHPFFLKELIISANENGQNSRIIGVVFPETLTRVELCDCEIGEGVVLALEKLPHLKFLEVRGGVGNKFSLSPDSFPQLTQLQIERQTELEEWEVGEGALPNLQHLWLSECKKLKKLNNFPHSLTDVQLHECEIGEGGSLLLGLEKLPHLKSLTLRTPVNMCNRLSFSPRSFPQLTQLNLYQLEELKELEFGDGAFPNLQYLKLIECKKLNKLNNIPNSLTQVVLRKCGIVISLLLAEFEMLPCLQKLHIQDDTHFTAIAGGHNIMSFSPDSFPNLAELLFTKAGCQIQLSFSRLEVGDGALPNIQRLELHGCRKLNTIPNSLTHVELVECEIGEAGGVSLLALESLPRLQQLTLRRPIIDGEGNKMSFCAGSFPQLRQLEIISAEELEELEIGDGALPNLQHLKLVHCSKLKRIPSNLPGSIDVDPPLKPAAASRFKLMSCLH